MATGESMIEPRPCGTCRAPVFDLAHARTGKLAPIDAEPSADGNVVINLDERTYMIIAKDTSLIRDGRVQPRHKNHWATCRDAAQWRKRYTQRFDGKP
jgi:hypothetical protein